MKKNKRTLGDKIIFLKENKNSYLLPYWRDEIILELDKINKKRIIFIHGISFIDPHKTGLSEIEYKKKNDIIKAIDVIETIELSKNILEKLLYIHLFYKSKDDDSVLKAFESGILKEIPFTFYPVSKERGFC
jgi:hypothetical protein